MSRLLALGDCNEATRVHIASQLCGGGVARLQRVLSKPSRCIGSVVLLSTTPDDPDGQAGVAAFNQALQQLGLDRRPSGAD